MFSTLPYWLKGALLVPCLVIFVYILMLIGVFFPPIGIFIFMIAWLLSFIFFLPVGTISQKLSLDWVSYDMLSPFVTKEGWIFSFIFWMVAFALIGWFYGGIKNKIKKSKN